MPQIKLLDQGLIRRHGKVIINADNALAKILVNKGLAVYLDGPIKKAPNNKKEVEPEMVEDKMEESPPENKAVLNPRETKGIFPKHVLNSNKD